MAVVLGLIAIAFCPLMVSCSDTSRSLSPNFLSALHELARNPYALTISTELLEADATKPDSFNNHGVGVAHRTSTPACFSMLRSVLGASSSFGFRSTVISRLPSLRDDLQPRISRPLTGSDPVLIHGQHPRYAEASAGLAR